MQLPGGMSPCGWVFNHGNSVEPRQTEDSLVWPRPGHSISISRYTIYIFRCDIYGYRLYYKGSFCKAARNIRGISVEM